MRGWGVQDRGLESSHCSCRGPESDSQHPQRQRMAISNSSARGADALAWDTFTIYTCVRTDM